MYNIYDIKFPDGTKINITQPFGFDCFDNNTKFPELQFYAYAMGYGSADERIPVYHPIDTSQTTHISEFGYGKPDMSYFTINSTNLTEITQGSNGVGPKILIFEGGSEKFNRSSLTDSNLIRLYYKYGDGDWTNFKKIFPITTIKIPFGIVPVRVRCLKNGDWVNGDEMIEYNHIPMEYLGGGLYGLDLNVDPYGRYTFPITVDGYGSSVIPSEDEVLVKLGDNSNITTEYVGEDIFDIVIQNDNEWFYNPDVNGVINNDIDNGENTSMTIQLPVNEITIVYGQDSEVSYDYCTVYDGSNNKIIDFKGISGDNREAKLTSNDGKFRFNFKKDGSASTGKDAFWIKSVSYTQLPPYPNN